MTNHTARQQTLSLINEGYELIREEAEAKKAEADNVTTFEFGGDITDEEKESGEDPTTQETIKTMASAIVELTDRLNNMQGGK